MKKKSLPFLLSLLMLLLVTSVYSQDTELKPATDRASRLTEWMKTNLVLRSDQTPRVYQINLKYAEKVDALKAAKTMSSSQKAKLLRSYDQSKDQELKGIFTADQYKNYLAKKKEIVNMFKQQMRAGQ